MKDLNMILKTSVLISVVLCVLGDRRPAISEQKVEQHFSGHHGDLSHIGHHDPEHHEEYAWSYPSYEFSYKVVDPHTHDIKEQHEVRHKDEVDGFYWLIQPDGHKRHVKYHADDKHGFTADVTYSNPKDQHEHDDSKELKYKIEKKRKEHEKKEKERKEHDKKEKERKEHEEKEKERKEQEKKEKERKEHEKIEKERKEHEKKEKERKEHERKEKERKEHEKKEKERKEHEKKEKERKEHEKKEKERKEHEKKEKARKLHEEKEKVSKQHKEKETHEDDDDVWLGLQGWGYKIHEKNGPVKNEIKKDSHGLKKEDKKQQHDHDEEKSHEQNEKGKAGHGKEDKHNEKGIKGKKHDPKKDDHDKRAGSVWGGLQIWGDHGDEDKNEDEHKVVHWHGRHSWGWSQNGHDDRKRENKRHEHTHDHGDKQDKAKKDENEGLGPWGERRLEHRSARPSYHIPH